ncbi:similar to Saccharomyces cerevisiae YDL155W CLB3 B-type cyclin involved in cell cycle progression [Maudiozyma saulgeensis]|uniref:Similar to Saccharomyces cerevisiae YDL155W CLB3 B-type cyclin involved in cell cycle progression n=1 Tax=Maudiozyma saulgeensis TaxID=1789683 RepID=A0A1X7R2M5_9SACH|nr:similar to Saccharomyces cerevisiae YDL155W CLB3 B-type cyclin involved in cell cycle progression [Kazachstania saulgeensis]
MEVPDQNRVLSDITIQNSNRLPSKTLKPRRKVPPPILDPSTSTLSESDKKIVSSIYTVQYDAISKEINKCISDFANLDTLSASFGDDEITLHDNDNDESPFKLIENEQTRTILKEAKEKYFLISSDPDDSDYMDPVLVAEYSDSIYKYMKKLEAKYKPKCDYMEAQTFLDWEFRRTLVDWLVNIHLDLDLIPETLFLAVNLMDRFLSKESITLNKFRLVGIAALFIATKMEEHKVPSLDEVLEALEGQYSAEEIIDSERFILVTLRHRLGWPGPMSFLRKTNKADDYDDEIRTHAKYFLEASLVESKFVACPPSLLAAGAYYISKHMVTSDDSWTLKHVFYSGYTKEQLVPLVKYLLKSCDNGKTTHKNIRKKYCKKTYSSTVKLFEAWRGK